MTENDSHFEENVMQEQMLFWGLLVASLTNMVCVCGYLDSCWFLGLG
jgi:hypothetical protein